MATDPGSAGPAAGRGPAANLKSGTQLTAHFEALIRDRSQLEQSWRLNQAFFGGDQYSYYSKVTGSLDKLPTEDHEKPNYRVRVTSNQMAPLAHNLLAKLQKSKPQFGATPGSAQERDVRAAELAEKLSRYWYQSLGLTVKTQEAQLNAINTGQGYLHIQWDPFAGKVFTFTLDPDGQPILDDELVDVYRAQIEQDPDAQAQGITGPETKDIPLGELLVDSVSPFDVIPDPNCKNEDFSDAEYCFVVSRLSPENIQAKFQLPTPPTPDSTMGGESASIPFMMRTEGAGKTSKRIVTGYFPPTAQNPDGRYVIFMPGHDAPLFDAPWPFTKTREIPIVKFPGMLHPGSFYDDCHATIARPIQKELNKTLSQIVASRNLTLNPMLLSPAGALTRRRVQMSPGGVLTYNTIAGNKPEWMQPPQLPNYVFELLREIQSRLEDAYSLKEVDMGTVPPNVEAAVAIDLLQEQASDRIAPTQERYELALGRMGRIMFAFAQQFYEEPRLIKIAGTNGSQIERFGQADLQGQVDIYVEAGSSLPRTRAGRMARLQSLAQLGLMGPQDMWKHADIADMSTLSKRFRADEDKAHREIDKLNRGEILNPEALQQAIAAIEAGQNPETGDLITSDAEVQFLVERAMLAPGPADNHQLEMEIHRQFIINPSFDNKPPDVRQRHLVHFMLTQEAAAMPPSPEPQSPRVTYQIKGTAGATASAKLLESAGVTVSPEEMSEEPLGTWVTDSVDKPDAETTGNSTELDPNEERIAQAKAEEAEVKVKLAKKKLSEPAKTSVSNSTDK